MESRYQEALVWRGHHVYYPRETVEVAIRITRPEKAKSVQDSLILKLNPRDNQIRPEPTPF